MAALLVAALPGRTAARAASVFKRKAAQYGSTITVAGQTCNAFPASVERGDASYLPNGLASNAAFPDLRAYLIAPDALPAPPAPGQAVTDQGRHFTVIAVPPADRIADVPVYQKFFVMQEVPLGSATTETATEPAPGSRKEYYPLPQ